MKKREGFISIVILIIFSLAIIMIIYLISIANLETLVLISTKNNVQSFYNSENKLLMCVYDKKYLDGQLIPNLFEAFRSRKFNTKLINIDKEDLEKGDTASIVKMKFRDIEGRKQLMLNCESMVNTTKTEVTSMGTVVNELFEIKTAIIDRYNLPNQYIGPLKDLISKIEENINIKNSLKTDNIYGFESDSYEFIDLTVDKLSCLRNTMSEPYIEFISKKEILIIGKKYKGENIELSIKKSPENDKISLSGVIYIEGNINVSTDFHFNGIIVVNGGDLTIDENVNVSVNGMIIYCNNDLIIEAKENLDVEYKVGQIYKYGTYIPGFLDIKLDLTKSN